MRGNIRSQRTGKWSCACGPSPSNSKQRSVSSRPHDLGKLVSTNAVFIAAKIRAQTRVAHFRAFRMITKNTEVVYLHPASKREQSFDQITPIVLFRDPNANEHRNYTTPNGISTRDSPSESSRTTLSARRCRVESASGVPNVAPEA